MDDFEGVIHKRGWINLVLWTKHKIEYIFWRPIVEQIRIVVAT